MGTGGPGTCTITTPSALRKRKVPPGYLVPRRLGVLTAWLRTHGVVLTPFQAEDGIRVESFHIDSLQRSEREFQGHRQVRLEGEYRPAQLEAGQGYLLASSKQPLGRLLFILLEPESDDGAVNWNFVDEELKVGDIFPVYRLLP